MRALALLLSLAIFPAHAQQQAANVCGPTDTIRRMLAEKRWSEVETTLGIMADGQSYMSIYISPFGRTWTAVIGNINGMSCVVAQGTQWFQGEVPVGDPA